MAPAEPFAALTPDLIRVLRRCGPGTLLVWDTEIATARITFAEHSPLEHRPILSSHGEVESIRAQMAEEGWDPTDRDLAEAMVEIVEDHHTEHRGPDPFTLELRQALGAAGVVLDVPPAWYSTPEPARAMIREFYTSRARPAVCVGLDYAESGRGMARADLRLGEAPPLIRWQVDLEDAEAPEEHLANEVLLALEEHNLPTS